MSSKFKYIKSIGSIGFEIEFTFEGNLDEAMNSTEEKWIREASCEKPVEIPDAAVREGSYIIRYKGTRASYEFYKGQWFFYYTNDTDFLSQYNWGIFPQKSEKEWSELNSFYPLLEEKFQKIIDNRDKSESTRKERRECLLDFNKSDKLLKKD